MNAKELRIGNWVSNGEKHYTVDVNMLYDIATCEHYPIEPIPLTPEILEQCGFTCINDTDNVHSRYVAPDDNNFYLEIDWRRREEGYDPLVQGCEGYACIGIYIQHLHQLQNLYFCLTGEELQINL